MDWQKEKHDWPNADSSRFIELAGTQLHVQRLGSGPQVLLLHGSGATTHSFDGLIAELASSYDLLVPDLPGHGFSSTLADRRATLHNVSHAVATLLELEDFHPQIIVGHSAGAAIAVYMTVGRMVAPKGIVSINGAFYPFPGFARHLFPTMAKMLFLNPFVPKLFAYTATDSERVRRLIESTGSILTEEQLGFYKRAFSSSNHVEGTLAMMANWDLETMNALLKRLPVPLLQIIGEKDGTIDPEASLSTARLVDDSSRVAFPKAGHLVHEEMPGPVASEIRSFAEQLGANAQESACAK